MSILRPKHGEPPFARDLLTTLAALAILATALATWDLRLTRKDEALSAEVGRLEREWTNAENELSAARATQKHVKAFLDHTNRILDEAAAQPLTPAIRSIALAMRTNIELKVIRLWNLPEERPGRALRVEGFAFGGEPRSVADEFCQRLQGELAKHFSMNSKCEFEKLNNEPDSPGDANLHKCSFVLIGAFGDPLPK